MLAGSAKNAAEVNLEREPVVSSLCPEVLAYTSYAVVESGIYLRKRVWALEDLNL
jgi:hypothetical protein